MNMPGAETLLIEEEGQIHAFLLMAADLRRRRATLVTLDVLSAHRRKGYASTLLLRSEEILIGHGVSTYELQVDVQNNAAIAFYHRHGFKEQRLLRNYYAGNRDAWQMVKTLQRSADT
jgi:ribosomal protein S18 acetylase RimI-like enzyme